VVDGLYADEITSLVGEFISFVGHLAKAYISLKYSDFVQLYPNREIK